MDYFYIVIQQIGMFIVYAVIGVIAVKTRIFGRKSLDILSRFITRIALPLLIFMNTVNGTEKEDFLRSWPMIVAAVVFYAILAAVSFFLRRLFGLRGNIGRVYQAAAMFGNIGFMGIPLLTALFPKSGILYITLFTIVDQLALWTIGVNLTMPVDGGIRYSAKKRLLKMINPCTIGIVLAIVFVFNGIRIPAFLNTALTNAGGVATPMALIYLGGTFCYVRIPEFLKKKEMYGLIAVKMFLLPLAFFFLFTHFPGLNRDMATAISLLAAMPTMTAVAMLAQNQHSAGDYAAGTIFMTTVFSVVTLPLVCLIIG